MQCAGKAKSNFYRYTRYEDVWESEDIAPIILNLSTVWRGVVRLTPRPFYIQDRAPKYPFYRMVCGHQARFGRFGGGKILLGSGIGTCFILPVVQPLYRLLDSDSCFL